ncbi:MAG: ABC transporter permease subunit [Deltaproteobacteria bacterium]
MNIYLNELRSLRKATIIWTCAIIALAALYLSIYPGVEKDAAGFRDVLSNYPASVRAMLGISLDTVTSLPGFYSMVLSFVTLCGAIQAMIFGVSILSRETLGRTVDFLFVKPVSRAAILNAKLLAALTTILAADVLYYAVVTIFANNIKPDYNHRLFLMINGTLLFIQLIYLALGILVSVVVPRLKATLSVSLGIVFGFYFIGAFFAADKNDLARFISPFRYFDTQYIITTSSYELPYLLAGLTIIIAALSASYLIYLRMDIHAAR